jgi:hypothetical protein
MTSQLSEWCVALIVIKFDEKHGQEIQSIFPINHGLDEQILVDIKMLSMPDCLEPHTDQHEFLYSFRVRDKQNRHSEVMNCFTSFRQCRDGTTKRGFFQQSVVLVSYLPYVCLYHNILTRLSNVLADLPIFEDILINSNIDTNIIEEDNIEISDKTIISSKVAPNPTSGIIEATLEVAFQHFLQWPSPKAGIIIRIPFYGEMIDFVVPFNDKTFDNKNIRSFLLNTSLDSGLYNSINLVSVLGPCGLLDHIWTLWEMMITGRDILVYSSNAAVCSSIVTALASLLSPLFFYGGDHRPYINPYDTDVTLLSKASDQKSSKDTCSSWGESLSHPVNEIKTSYGTMLIGITNPFLLRSFSRFQCCIFVPNPYASKLKVPPRTISVNNSTCSSSTSYFGSFFSSSANVTVSKNLGFHGAGLYQSQHTAESKTNIRNFSPLGVKVNSEDIGVDIFRKTGRKKNNFFCDSVYHSNLRVLDINDSLENVYDEWQEVGMKKYGLTGIICSRSYPLILPDKDIQRRLSMLSTEPRNVCESINMFDCEKSVVGNMLLREHFRLLTCSFLKPFDCINTSSISDENIENALESFSLFEPNVSSLPNCLLKTNWKLLMRQFGNSDHFEKLMILENKFSQNP